MPDLFRELIRKAEDAAADAEGIGPNSYKTHQDGCVCPDCAWAIKTGEEAAS
jgi:hypothetical protein